MGTINNKFTCLEITTYEYYEDYEEIVSRYKDIGASLYIGSNGYIFVTIPPSGSKVGWGTSNKHVDKANALLAELEQETENNDDYLTVKEVTTSYG